MFVPSRLRLARLRRGMTFVALAKAIHERIQPRTLSAYERGVSIPTDDSVDQFAQALSFPRDFFFAKELEEAPVDGVSFRALTRMTASQRDAAIASGTLALAVYQWLDERFELPDPAIPELDRGIIDPESAAEFVRSEWGLGSVPVGNLVHLLEARGVRLFSLADDCREVDAFSFWWRGTPVVSLNARKTAERTRFDAAHELGHLVLHRDGGSPRGRTEEHEANLFASAFLIPEADARQCAPRFPSWGDLVDAKARWRVSVAALNYRMHQLGMLSDWHYRELCIEIARFGREREPNGCSPEHSQVLAKAFQALRSEGVSRSDVARDLFLYPDELEAHVAGLMTVSIDGGGETSISERTVTRHLRPV